HAEMAIIRWDKNGNNYFDSNEADDAYPIYSTALDEFLQTKPKNIRRLQKQIYQYLLKYEQIPDDKDSKKRNHFVRFLLRPNKRVTANRKTVSAVFVMISEEDAKMNPALNFDCNLLRDPPSIPREPGPRPAIPGRTSDFSSFAP